MRYWRQVIYYPTTEERQAQPSEATMGCVCVIEDFVTWICAHTLIWRSMKRGDIVAVYRREM
jgi:hypothetical protein